MQWLTIAYNSNNVPHGGMGFNVEIKINGIPFTHDIVNSLLWGSSWSWMLPSNKSNPCGKVKKSRQHN
jgi:hypothetical protein